MSILLFLLSIIAGFIGFAIMYDAKSAIHEIESFILFLIASVLFSGAIITDAVNKVRKKLDSESEEEDTALNR
jgi:hypothetical protein